jgi:hypothetical protein
MARRSGPIPLTPEEEANAIEHELANELDTGYLQPQNGATWPASDRPALPPDMYPVEFGPSDHVVRFQQPEVDHIGVVAVAAEALRETITIRGASDASNDLTHVLQVTTGAMEQLYDRVRELHETLAGRYESEGWSKPSIEDVHAMPIFERIRYESRETARIALAIRAVLDAIESGLKG